MSSPCVDVLTHALQTNLGKYRAKEIEAFYRTLHIVIVTRPKNNHEDWNDPSQKKKKKKKTVRKWKNHSGW